MDSNYGWETVPEQRAFWMNRCFRCSTDGNYDLYAAKGEVAYMRDKSTLAKAYIRAHPAEFLRLSAVRFIRFWTGTGNKEGSIFFHTPCGIDDLSWMRWVSGASCKSGRVSLAVLFLLPLMLFPLPYYITHAEFRYRLVIDPLLTILAAYAVSGSRDCAEKR